MEKTSAIGVLLVVAIAVIVGLVLLSSAANTVQNSTNTVALNNYTLTTGANGSQTALTGYQAVDSTYTIYNGSTSAGTNVTLVQVTSNGALGLYAQVNYPGYASKVVNITAATVEPTGYIGDSASRSIAGLIIIFGALAIAVVALFPVVKEHLGFG